MKLEHARDDLADAMREMQMAWQLDDADGIEIAVNDLEYATKKYREALAENYRIEAYNEETEIDIDDQRWDGAHGL